MKILFFVESLQTGGKERRMMELIQYLTQKTDYEVALIITEDEIHFKNVYDLGIPLIIIKRRFLKYDPLLFIKFYKFCNNFKPDIIHAWGKMCTFYAIPTKVINNTPLVSNLIADSNKKLKNWSLDSIFLSSGIFLSNVILSNSKAGLSAYNINTPKARVIPNGVNLKRFSKKFDICKEREVLGVKTVFMLVMVASFSSFKDYDLFIEVAKELGKIRDDVTFVGVGDGTEWKRIEQRIKDEHLKNVLLTGNKTNVESIVAASDIGLLFSPSEGISNSIIEYMALGKPVITTDISGGSKEIVIEGETGYCTDRNIQNIISLINLLLNDADLRNSMGEKGRKRITTHFSIERMGKEFENVYDEVLNQIQNKTKDSAKFTADRMQKTISTNKF